MIEFYSENNFVLDNAEAHRNWLNNVVNSEGKTLGEISYIFCDDDYLHDINVKFLNHDDYTDIISFDETLGNLIAGDIFISTERVKDNAEKFEVAFEEELRRVLSHGVLHFCGYKDKTEEEAGLMRQKEDEKMKMFHVEH